MVLGFTLCQTKLYELLQKPVWLKLRLKSCFPTPTPRRNSLDHMDHIRTHFVERDESLGIITDLSDSILHHASSPQNKCHDVNVNRGYSLSLEDISPSRESDTADDSGYTKSSSNCNLSKTRKNKYDHIESKVKLYRLEIQKQQKMNKKKRCSDSHSHLNIVTENNIRENMDVDSLLNELEFCKEKIKEYEQQVVERDVANEILTKQIINLMQENSDTKIRMDYLRLETQRYKNMLASGQQYKSETPLSKRINKNSQLSLLRTPIRTLSKTLLTPLRNLHKGFTPDTGKSSSESESDDEEYQNMECYRTFVTEPKLTELCDFRSSPTTSDVPLIRSTDTKFTTRVKILFLDLITCSKSNISNGEMRNAKENITLKKIMKNKVHPLSVASNTSENAFETYRKISIRKQKDDIKVPTITITTPTSPEDDET